MTQSIPVGAVQRTTQTSRAVLEVHDVTKSLPLGAAQVEILKGISLDVVPGQVVTILGPSGSGKSTLLGILSGLDAPTSGQVVIGGTDITHLGESRLAGLRNRSIGMVFQSFNLISSLTAQENVELPLYVGRHPGNASKRSQEVLALVGLSHRLANRPYQLSGGEQQRVAIARALVTSPAVVFMDEPTGNLDRANGNAVLALIQELRERTGTTFVIATHDPAVAEVADRAIHIADGRIVHESPTRH